MVPVLKVALAMVLVFTVGWLPVLLISAATYLLKRQIDSKAKAFLDDGGFSERMARMRRKNLNG